MFKTYPFQFKSFKPLDILSILSTRANKVYDFKAFKILSRIFKFSFNLMLISWSNILRVFSAVTSFHQMSKVNYCDSN